MKRKWALGLREGLMTRAVRSLPEMIIFLVFSWLFSNHRGEQGKGGREDREQGNKEKAGLAFHCFF